jgi:Cu-Zn family superoxide dismutase
MNRLGLVVVLVVLGMLPSAVSQAETGVAIINGTAEGSAISGRVDLQDTDEGLWVSASISGAPPGVHGFHIHEFGRCEEGGQAAGNHFNPEGVEHGDLLADGLDNAHAGDLGNLEVGHDGIGTFTRLYPDLVLSGDVYAVAGRAFILHANPDDFSQPAGNAGARIGCGTIVITGH